jgi:hypothetical protein
MATQDSTAPTVDQEHLTWCATNFRDKMFYFERADGGRVHLPIGEFWRRRDLQAKISPMRPGSSVLRNAL